MKRTHVSPALTLILGIALGVGTTSMVNAMHPPVKVEALYKSDLATADGQEGSIFLAALAPGANVGRHYHPGDAFAYVLEGTMLLEIDGRPSVTLKAGEGGSLPPRVVHDDKNPSAANPLKFLVFHVARKGAPLTVSAQ